MRIKLTFICAHCLMYFAYAGSGYPSLTLPSPYETICGYPGSGYPTYQQSYSCLAPYPPTSFSSMSPYQACLHIM